MKNEIQYHLRLPKDLWKKIKSESEKTGETISTIIRIALRKYFK